MVDIRQTCMVVAVLVKSQKRDGEHLVRLHEVNVAYPIAWEAA